MNKVVLVLASFFTLFSCNKMQCQKVKKINTDTITIKNTTAISFMPTDNAIEKQKKEIGKEAFYVGADDYLYYMNETDKYLKSKKINIVTIKNNKILKFVSANKTVTIINLKNESEIWGIYLFDPKQKPKKVDLTAIEEEYKEYFIN